MSSEITYSAFESRYKNRQYIGSGGFAKVYKVFDHANNHYVALKIADVKPEWDKFTLKNEVELVNKLPRHRNIARYDACYRFNTGSLTGEMDFAILRFYEYGNLEQFLKKEKITLEDKRIIIKGVLEGIAFLHRNNVIHRDLKAQNILLHREDGVWTPKITDFGLSREVLEHGDITNSAIGLSYSYAAPEQIQNKKILKNVDLWAAGVIIYRVIADELPFKGREGGDSRSTQSQLVLSRKIINLELPPELETLPEPYRTMVKRCLVLKPEERVQTAEELIHILEGKEQISAQPAVPVVPPEVEADKTEVMANPVASDQQVPPVVSPPAPNPQTVFPPSAPEIVPPPTTPAPVVSADEKTEVIIPPAPQQPVAPEPLAFTPPSTPVEDYSMPRENVTQFLERNTAPATAPEPAPTTNFQPNTGDPKRTNWWLWILIPLLLAGLGFGGYYVYENFIKNDSVISEPFDDDNPPLVTTIDRFAEIDQDIETAKNDKTELRKIIADLEKKIKSQSNNYRPIYLKSKALAYLNESRKAIKNLREATIRAIKNGDSTQILSDIESDKDEAFKKIQKIQPDKYWNKIIGALEEAR